MNIFEHICVKVWSDVQHKIFLSPVGCSDAHCDTINKSISKKVALDFAGYIKRNQIDTLK